MTSTSKKNSKKRKQVDDRKNSPTKRRPIRVERLCLQVSTLGDHCDPTSEFIRILLSAGDAKRCCPMIVSFAIKFAVKSLLALCSEPLSYRIYSYEESSACSLHFFWHTHRECVHKISLFFVSLFTFCLAEMIPAKSNVCAACLHWQRLACSLQSAEPGD